MFVRARHRVVESLDAKGFFAKKAHASKEWEINANAAGPKPVLVDIRTASKESLDAKLAETKANACIATAIDLVSTEDGSILLPERFGMLKESCSRHRLLLTH
ncbi:hypothetical protein MFIFM68171_00799 [Madurella fahalii]|uniref:Uncharacterized protein n=1 Tax=Madurella fahalii TaxID=1157608 RepID=A0ABQ0FYU8_9PEZI